MHRDLEPLRITYRLALSYADQLPPATHPLKAVKHLAALSGQDPVKLAGALALLGVETLASWPLLLSPNDRPFLETLRLDPMPRDATLSIHETLTTHPPEDAAATLSISPWLALAACHILNVRPVRNRMQLRTRRELELDNAGREVVRALMLSVWSDDHLTLAIRLGVRKAWLERKLRGLNPKPADDPLDSPLASTTRLTPREKEQIREAVRVAGSISAWARRSGTHYLRALELAREAGADFRGKGRKAKASIVVAKQAITDWLSETGYTGETNGRSSLWIAEHVLGMTSLAQYNRSKMLRIMKALGFRPVCRGKSSDVVWVKEGISVQKHDKTFQARTSDNYRTEGSLGKPERLAKKTLRHKIESGQLQNPTPQQLRDAGLAGDGLVALRDWRAGLE